MNPANVDDFYFATSEVLLALYAGFPVRRMLLVEDISGPIKWDLTGLPDRKSQATFETLVWLADHGLLTFRTVEPRDIGLEGAVLTQHGFVLLSGPLTWADGTTVSRIDAIKEARRTRAYDDLGSIIKDLFQANCHWAAPAPAVPLVRSPQLTVREAVQSEELTDSVAARRRST